MVFDNVDFLIDIIDYDFIFYMFEYRKQDIWFIEYRFYYLFFIVYLMKYILQNIYFKVCFIEYSL